MVRLRPSFLQVNLLQIKRQSSSANNLKQGNFQTKTIVILFEIKTEFAVSLTIQTLENFIYFSQQL